MTNEIITGRQGLEAAIGAISLNDGRIISYQKLDSLDLPRGSLRYQVDVRKHQDLKKNYRILIYFLTETGKGGMGGDIIGVYLPLKNFENFHPQITDKLVTFRKWWKDSADNSRFEVETSKDGVVTLSFEMSNLDCLQPELEKAVYKLIDSTPKVVRKFKEIFGK
jgi:hypothetical protein